MAKYVGYKRPKDTKKAIKHLLVYLGHYKWMFMLVALLVLISVGANVAGTYLVKPVVNHFIVPGELLPWVLCMPAGLCVHLAITALW